MGFQEETLVRGPGRSACYEVALGSSDNPSVPWWGRVTSDILEQDRRVVSIVAGDYAEVPASEEFGALWVSLSE